MKRIVLCLILLLLPAICQAAPPGFLKERMGTLSGQVLMDDGKPLPGGVVAFFNTETGPPPLMEGMHRIPDSVGRVDTDGKFSIPLAPASYYLGALVISDPGRGPGPPRAGEKYYFAADAHGELLTFSVPEKKVVEAGVIQGYLPEALKLVKDSFTVQGTLFKDDGTPFEGAAVLVKTRIDNLRPLFISPRTGKDGKYTLKLPAGKTYFLLARERAVGRPVPGTYIGTYGITSSIEDGGAVPIGDTGFAQPAGGRPEGIDAVIPTSQEKPLEVTGNAGSVQTGLDIFMFKMPVPGEQREKLQGTLGFSQPQPQEQAPAAEPVPPPAPAPVPGEPAK